MKSRKVYVGIEYGKDMSVKEIKTTESIEIVNKWLYDWANFQNEKYNYDKVTNINYLNLLAEVKGEIQMFKVTVTETEVP